MPVHQSDIVQKARKHRMRCIDEIREFALKTQLNSEVESYTSFYLGLEAIKKLKPYELDETIVGYEKIPFRNDYWRSSYFAVLILKEVCVLGAVSTTNSVLWEDKTIKLNNTQRDYVCEYPFYDMFDYGYFGSCVRPGDTYLILAGLCVEDGKYIADYLFGTRYVHQAPDKPIISNCVYVLFQPIRENKDCKEV
ncbi:hypothetical protein AX774_g4263 [Zancudomyces culisetae]|uniref:Uncharacterized protein n=1 Tax=Zancudomyces culisetae TaxID=1213189 RepID=A0A1R1PMT7_ZANCU|nr:hypothetical protein AX774_g4263 [Zancudomyces culisetae]|eukprot:OMH82264.1 hypothetical protein AX774_g4263 [Zancudomyces culisetae]